VLLAEIMGLTWTLECFERILDSCVIDKRTKLPEFREILVQRRSIIWQERRIFCIAHKRNVFAIITKPVMINFVDKFK